MHPPSVTTGDLADRMSSSTVNPVRLTGPAALRWGWRFARDPLMGTRRAFDAFGPFVILADALPPIRPRRAALLGVPLVLTAGAAFHRELLSAPERWRGVSLLPGGPRGSAARRMSAGLTRLTGERHAHYRKLLLLPLRKSGVEAMTQTMAEIADAQTAAWPLDTVVDLWDCGRQLMRAFAVELLFGGDTEPSRAIADLVSSLMERKWDWAATAFPINLPITAYGRIVRDAEVLQAKLLQWVAGKRGSTDEGDLASIVVNAPDADGNLPDDAAVVGQLASLFAAAAEASHSALIWSLLLLTQHPRVAADLLDELHGKLGAASPPLAGEADLPYLDAVAKEAMRVLPPVPVQIRVAQDDTTIAGHPVPKGTRVMLNTFLTNRADDLYPAPDAFRPERWSTIAPSAFEFPVFSAGPHGCPGYWFGLSAVKIALAAIVTRYRIELPADARVDYRVQPTLRPRAGLRAVLRREDGSRRAARPIAGSIRNLIKFPA
jgi:cytochrome P450